MRTMKSMLSLCAGVALLVAKTADAQVPSPATEKYFVSVNFGGQLAPRTIGTSITKSVYDETATFTSTQPVSRGAVFDVGGGVRVWGDVYAGIVISRFSDSADASYSAEIPSPLVFGLLKRSEGIEGGRNRTETAINPNVIWAMTLTDKIDLALGVGASIIKLKQQLISGFDVPQGTQDVSPIFAEESGTAKGLYASVDFIYNLMPRYGIGGFVRYAGGKVDLLPSLVDHNVGGMQAGGGVRLRF